MDKTTRIVILGGGFAGVYTARRLLKKARRTAVQVHLVNREDYMVFHPMLPEVIYGSVGIADTVSPIRRIVPGVTLHMREVESIDIANQTVTCSPGFRPRSLVLEYDHLVLALGNVTDFRGLTGLAEHAKPFKTLGDALALRNHVIRILEEADTEQDPKLRAQLLTFVVAGGGFSGAGVIAQLDDFVRRACKSFANIGHQDCRMILLHWHDRILPEVDQSLALYAQKLLLKRGIKLVLGQHLGAATADYAILKDGTRIATKTLIPTVASHPNPVIDALDLPKERGKVMVNTSLCVHGTYNVWAVGDCALVQIPLRREKKTIQAPPTAQYALREGRLCASNILAAITQRPVREFLFTGRGSMASLGHHRGVAQVLGLRISGLPAWLIWRAVYLSKLPGLDRKLRVGISWLLDLFLPPDLVQLRVGKSSGINQEHFEPGQCIFEQGDLGDRVYIVVRGKAEVVRKTDMAGDGEQPGEQVIADLVPGQYFGEMALLTRSPRNTTVRCVEPMDVLSIEKGDFSALISHLDDMRGGLEKTATDRAGPGE